jgi:selenocysteine lyase/cysteine desulfurase
MPPSDGPRPAVTGTHPPIPSQRHLFDIPREVAYLNCGYMSPLLREVLGIGQHSLARKAHPWTITPPDFFRDAADARTLFAALIGRAASDIAIVPSVSYGMAVATANLPLQAGQRVLMLDEGFPSVVYPWRERARDAGAEAVLIPRPADDDWTAAVLDAIDDRTAVAALPVCHWTDGGLLDLRAISARLREVGAALAIDATQSLGALPFDLHRVRPDFLVAASYKWLLGPYSLGFLYVAPRWQGGRPVEHNWIAREGSEDFAGLVRYREGFQPGARRFDQGELPFVASLPMAVAALRQIQAWQVDRISATLAGLTGEIARRAALMGIGSVPENRRAPHYLGLRFRDGVPAGLGERLAAHRVFVSTRGRSLRVTPHLYNDQEDLDRFFHALGTALDTGPARA